MEKDLIAKIKTIAAKKEHMDEDSVRSFMILVRKLLDKMPQSDQNFYLTLRLFCNWVAHIEITKSITGSFERNLQEKERSSFSEKSRFDRFNLAPISPYLQTIPIILPNLIHGCKRKDLGH